MNFKQYEALYWAARLGSFHAASRRLSTTQPAISARIRALESHYGVTVFTRDGHRPRLTFKGQELFHYASRLMQLSAEVKQRLGASDVVNGHVRLGVASVPAVGWLPNMMRSLNRSHPGIDIAFTIAPSASLAAMLSRRELDLAVLSGPISELGLRGQWLGKIVMAWLCSPEMDLPIGPLAAADLSSLPIISDIPGSQLHGLVTEWFRSQGAEPAHQHACSTMTTRLQIASSGLGIAIAPKSGASRELSVGELRIVPTVTPLPDLEYFLVHSEFELEPATAIVAELARDMLSERLNHF